MGLRPRLNCPFTQNLAHPPRTHVLMLTANAVAGNPAVFQDAGADGYLTKPVQSATLLSAIARAASHTPGAP